MKRGLFDMAWWSSDSNRGPDPSDPDPEAGSEVTADPFWAEDNWGWKKETNDNEWINRSNDDINQTWKWINR